MAPITSTEKCLNCGAELNGKFCHECGQKSIEDNERTFKYFIYQFFGSAFFLENNFLKSLWFVLSRPGFLASEYLHGRRKRYMTPISLFLLINLIYFFSVSLSDLNLSLTEQMFQLHGSVVRKMAASKVESRGITMDEYEQRYNEQSTSLSKTLIILHVPVLAAILMLLYKRKEFYFSDHIVFALYIISFVLLFNMLLFMLLIQLARWELIQPQTVFSASGMIFLLVLPAYFFQSVRKFYGQRIMSTIPKTIAIILAFVASHLVYRALLFFAVFWTT